MSAPDFEGLYDKYRGYTMIPRSHYLDNLLLATAAHHVAGDIVECGVWRGGMIAGIADVLGPERAYYLYDSYQGLPKAAGIDGERALTWQADTSSPEYYDNCTAPEHVAVEAMGLSCAQKVQSIRGWFSQTVSRTCHPAGIALLRLDADWYESTLHCLRAMFPQVVTNGIVIIDDYYTWDGCTRAVHDYLSEGKHAACIRCTATGVCYIVK